MPFYGIIRDSPLIYAAQRVARRARPSGAPPRSRVSFGSTVPSQSAYRFSKLKIYDGALYAFLNTPKGELWWHLEKRAAIMVANSKLQVGVRTGALRNSIRVMYHKTVVTGQELKIGSNVNYALLHHEGSRPHQIRPRQGNTLIRFRGKSGMVFTDVVNHPGTKPNRYLSDQLYHFRY